MLDEEPVLLAAATVTAPGPHQHPRSFQLLAMERKFQIAFLQRLVDMGYLGCPSAAIPQHHRCAAVLWFRNDAFKITVLNRMILDTSCEAFHGGIERRTLRNSPGKQHSAPFQSKIIVQVGGLVFLHNVQKVTLRGSDRCRSFRFLGYLEVPLLAVFPQISTRSQPARSLPGGDLLM